MKTVTYAQIEQLASDLGGFPRGKLPVSDAAMLRAFFAAELPDLWNREAWPELCDHLEAVTLDASNCFSLREDTATEMGDLLAIITGGNPLTTSQVTVLPREQYTRLDDRVNVLGPTITGGIYVDWQTPAPDLLDSDLDVAATLAAYTLPARFKLPLAARGAALLIAEEDPLKAGALRGLAEAELNKQASRITRPWWRK